MPRVVCRPVRIWCCFEEGIVLLAQRGMLNWSENDGRGALKSLACRDGQEGRRTALLLDIATVHEGQAQLLTQGLTADEEQMEREKYAGSGWQAKTEREEGFPIEIVVRGLDVSLRDASASKATHKTQTCHALLSNVTMKQCNISTGARQDEDLECAGGPAPGRA